MLIVRSFIFGPSWKVVKESIKLLCQYFKTNYIMRWKEDVICFNRKEWFVIIIYPWEDIIIKRDSDNFYKDKYWF